MASEEPRFALADVEFLDGLILKRERKGTEWCCEKGIGARRDGLSESRVDMVKVFKNTDADDALRATRKRLREELRDICHACGACKWAGM